MKLNRRRFMVDTAGVAMVPLLCQAGRAQETPSSDETAARPGPPTVPDTVVTVDVGSGDELQQALFRHAGAGNLVRVARPAVLTCVVREDVVGDEKSIHPLLVPEGVQLDLNGATLRLDLRSNCYGVRLSNDSAIRNGAIQIVRSEGKGSQACWHSGVSVGAAYGDGGTPDKPGRFSTVARWAIENVTIDQQVAASAIQLMSEACQGLIKNVRILSSNAALLGIGLDWGSVGPIVTADNEIPAMRRLWEQGLIYSTHPHDVAIENIRVGKLLRNVDGNDAGVRCSACHRIAIRDVEVEAAATAVAIFGGDLGYEFAREDQRDTAHVGYLVEDVRIAKAFRYGIVLNGSADNVWRSRLAHGYDSVRDPVHPGLDKPVVRNAVLRGGQSPAAQGIYAVALSGAELDNVDIEGFDIGVHVEDWVRGMRFSNCRVAGNNHDIRVEGATEPAVDVVFDPPRKE